MNVLGDHCRKGCLHHAYLISGDFEVSCKNTMEVASVLLGVKDGKVEVHPDFSHIKIDSFGIGDSKQLRERASKKSLSGGNKVFVIETNSFTLESSNALLKLLEEPTQGTYFFVVVPTPDIVIPTLRSRFISVNNIFEGPFFAEEAKNGERASCFEFIRQLPLERSKTVDKIIKSKDKQKAMDFLNELELIVSTSTFGSPTPKLEALGQIQKGRDYLATRGSSIKMILEHLVLALPIIK